MGTDRSRRSHDASVFDYDLGTLDTGAIVYINRLFCDYKRGDCGRVLDGTLRLSTMYSLYLICVQTISPLSAEIASLPKLPSMLALTFGTVLLSVTFTEVIALKIRQPSSSRRYLYPQIFTGVAYLIASGVVLALWLVQRRGKMVGA